ncbi:hypothetical protein [Homoserinimonas hongtaonis]|uniref:hypothetical protein n=1 Tax=Homoserinimonas hongtaonis TaxID=2079791 RepID=UPI000D33ACAF|nr:hypothetical protein [Salinibacterium hongtaonis]AWB89783.1 hypothetical protein C2138_09780 [Salinibacterium hongtaonis]
MPRRPARGGRGRSALAAIVLLAPIAGIFAPLAAVAQEPTPSANAVAPALAAAAPLIAEPADGAFIDRNRVVVSGQGTEAGNTVTVSLAGSTACTTVVAVDLAWECLVPSLPNTAAAVIAAVESLADGTTNDATITLAVLGPPLLDEVSPTPGYVTGSGHPDSTVTVSVAGTTCAVRVAASGYWSCTPLSAAGAKPATGSHPVSAQQSHPAIGAGSSSALTSRTIAFDTQRPEPPVILQPSDNSRVTRLPANFRGTGENGATVDVYLGGVPVCAAVVSGGEWGCAGGSGTTSGSQTARAVQRDQANNYSDPSAIVRFSVGPAAPAQTLTPTPSPTTEPSPSAQPSAPPASYPPASESPWPLPEAGSPLAEALANWGTPTDFSSGIPGLHESIERGNWWRAPLLALVAILLVALPLRLLASTLRGRIRWPFGQITGRNTVRETPAAFPANAADATAPGWWTPWLAMSLPFAVTVAFMVVAGGVSGEVRYLRLAVAIAGALALINVVGVAVATRIGSAWQRVDTQFRFRGLLFAAAIVSGLVSRLIGLSPPLVTGTLIGMRPDPTAAVHKRAIVGLIQGEPCSRSGSRGG